eukprot:TRINITY_DN1887_c0_g1_i2.p1 TRINITY_DN1887_c0_g1~~TRINITY_DN1887_c0_g1_i2.p1  ORF type:complete len:1026 (+),score=125.36 TRINITY_DN1887_c0_g1_i2:771-3848(+)
MLIISVSANVCAVKRGSLLSLRRKFKLWHYLTVLLHSKDYPETLHVIQHVLPHVSRQTLKSIPSLLVTMLPPRPCDDSRQLFLQSAIHMYSSGVAFEVQQQPTLNDVLCASFISSKPVIRELAAKLLQMCFKKSSLSNTFEYLIEGLRDAHLPPIRSKRKALVKPSLAALSTLAPSVDPIHWCYAFRSVLSISEYADEAVHHLCQVIKTAVSTAPPSVFGAALIPELIAFVMRLMCDENLPSAAECLQILLQRYRTNIEELESILGVLECIVEKNIRIAFPIVQAAVLQFKRLAGKKVPRDELQPLGRRLVIVIFDRCATQLEDFHGFEDDIEHIVNMLCHGLDEVFAQTGACSDEDRFGIQRWCWRFLPPRKAMTATCDSLPLYLWRISTATAQSMATENLESLCSEENFLAEISGDRPIPAHSPVFLLVDKAIQLHCIDNICLPEALLEALLQRLHLLKRYTASDTERDASYELRILRLISHVCFQHGLCFPADDIEEQTVQNILRNPEFSPIDEADRLFLRAVISYSKRGPLDVYVWDTVTSNCRNPLNKTIDLDDIITTVVIDEGGSESMLYALSHSTIPEVIVEGVLDIFERKKGYDALYNALLKTNGLSVAYSVLKVLPHRGVISAYESVSDNDIEHKRSASFLLLISIVGIIHESADSWDLLRIVCDTFTRESISYLTSISKIDLLSHLARCIIALLRGMKDSGQISFIRHSGVEAQGIKLLTSITSTTRASGLLISSIACLLNLFMHKTDLDIYVMPELPINLEFLTEPKTWEKLLTPKLGLEDADETNRMANCWHLLNSLLRGGKGDSAKFQSIITPNIVVLVNIAATSWNRLLSEAAQTVLRTVLQLKYHERSVLRFTGVFKELCSFVVDNFCISQTDQLTSSQILLLSELLRNSFIDQDIPELLERISNWRNIHEDSGRDLSQQPLFSEMSTLYGAISQRLQHSPAGKSDSYGMKLHLSHATLSEIFKQSSSETPNYFPDVLLGRYTMVWRPEGLVGSEATSKCRKEKESNGVK